MRLSYLNRDHYLISTRFSGNLRQGQTVYTTRSSFFFKARGRFSKQGGGAGEGRVGEEGTGQGDPGHHLRHPRHAQSRHEQFSRAPIRRLHAMSFRHYYGSDAPARNRRDQRRRGSNINQPTTNYDIPALSATPIKLDSETE